MHCDLYLSDVLFGFFLTKHFLNWIHKEQIWISYQEMCKLQHRNFLMGSPRS